MTRLDSVRVEQSRVDAFAADPHNPFLVSFPRTGSHWLRMVIELTFGRPTLVRNFYFPERHDYILLHTHDDDLALERPRVLYLWRDPVPTVFSQLRYEQAGMDRADVTRCAERYGQHLHKWLVAERFTEHKTVVTYETLRRSPEVEMERVAALLALPLDVARLGEALERVTHDEVRSKTVHDPRVVSERSSYDDARDGFDRRWSSLVHDVVLERRPGLGAFVEAGRP